MSAVDSMRAERREKLCEENKDILVAAEGPRTNFVECRLIDGCIYGRSARLWRSTTCCLPCCDQPSDDVSLVPKVFVAVSLHKSFSLGTVNARRSLRSSDSLADCSNSKIDRAESIHIHGRGSSTLLYVCMYLGIDTL